MASERLDTAEKIVRMTEWNNAEAWEYAEGEEKVKDPLAAAKRYVSAQAFLLSWQEGKVPTGWRRPRRLADFEGKYPQHVLDTVQTTMSDRISERNMERTAQINAVLTATRSMSTAADDDGGDTHIDLAQRAAQPSPIPVSTNSKRVFPPAPHKKSESTQPHGNSLSKAEVGMVKRQLAQFSSQLADAKAALDIATNTAAEISMKLQAIKGAVDAAAH